MELNLINLVMALIAMSSGTLDASEQDFAGYVDGYNGSGWGDPYSNETQIIYVNNTIIEYVEVPVIEYVYINNCSNETELPEEPEVMVGGKVSLHSDIQIHNDDSIENFGLLVDYTNERADEISYAYGLGDQVDDHNKDWQYNNFTLIDSGYIIDRDYVKGNHEGRKVDDWDDNDMILRLHNNTCFALMNSYSEFQNHGSWTDEQILWVDQSLESNNGVCDYYVILSHHGIYDPTYGERPGAVLMRGVLEAHLDDYNFIRHYRGHNDWFEIDSTGGIDYVTVPSVRHLGGDINPATILYDPLTGLDELCYVSGRCEPISYS